MRHLTTTTLLAALALAPACGDALDEEPRAERPGDGLVADQGMGDAGASESDADTMWPPEPDTGEVIVIAPRPTGDGAACVVGQAEACTCDTGEAQLSGERVCLEAGGVYSQCSCPFEYPYEGPTCRRGALECGYLVESQDALAGGHCCTLGGECGLSNFTVFGLSCVKRGLAPVGKTSSACGPTLIPFIDVEDCCRPDNTCGLRLLSGDNWGELGCVERSELAQMLKSSYLLGIFLGLFQRGDLLDSIEPSACTY